MIGIAPMVILVVDPQPIYRLGLRACLRTGLGERAEVHDVGSAAAARRHPALATADVVLVDASDADGRALVGELASGPVRVLAYCGNDDVAELRTALRDGVVAVLVKATMTPGGLLTALQAAAEGSRVLAPELLAALVRDPAPRSPPGLDGRSDGDRDRPFHHGPTRDGRANGWTADHALPGPTGRPPALAAPLPLVSLAPRADAAAGRGTAGHPMLTPRERHVLRLIAGGHATREVARELSYSERTVKNVLHDAVTKLEAKSRSQAVAHAVREGLI